MSIDYIVDGPASDEELNALFDDAWPKHDRIDFQPLLAESLSHVLAKQEGEVVGFVRATRCGTAHAMVFGPTVRTDVQGQGVGTRLLEELATAAKGHGVSTLHVEFAATLRAFYRRAGYRHTAGGVLRL